MQNDPNRPFVVPPPPATGSKFFSPEELAVKAKFAATEARDALIISIFGIFCFGFILGIIGLRKANSALETMDMYDVAYEKRGLAKTAKILSIVDIVLWGLGLIAKIVFR